MTRVDVLLYVGRRLAVLALLLVAISFAVFSLLYLAPGNAVDTLLGLNPRSPATIRALRHEYHLDKPFLTQYWIWARDPAPARRKRPCATGPRPGDTRSTSSI